ncbi:MAG: hypothetical protein ACE5DY_03140 [Mariprofundaceae bacterium]
MIQWQAKGNEQSLLLHRRGFKLGWISEGERPTMPDIKTVVAAWKKDKAMLLPGLVSEALQQHASAIEQSLALMEKTLNGVEVASMLEAEPYPTRLQPEFFLVASSTEEHDKQGIEKLYFDTEDVDNLWCKASWLSFHDEDASLRFRFSFGLEGFEDVAADPFRQKAAARLCDRVFTESSIITENKKILEILNEILGVPPAFVERIVYFNAPDGGAQMHHDVERGHDGVVFAQLSGASFWLALAKPELMDELIAFSANSSNGNAICAVLTKKNDRDALFKLLADRKALSDYMDESDHELVEAVVDRSPEFIRHLVEQGYAHVLHAGDALLLPQRDLDNCVWHSVISLGDEPGEALSFAVRRKNDDYLA